MAGTAGTSAATAHVAGAAALLRQARLGAGLPVAPADLRAVLAGSALDLGAPGPDPLYGAAWPGSTPRAPALSVRIARGARRLVRARADDQGTIRACGSRSTGAPCGWSAAPWSACACPRCARGAIASTVTAEDMAGNVACATAAAGAGR